LKYAFVVLASPLHDPALIKGLLSRVRSTIQGLYDREYGVITSIEEAKKISNDVDAYIALIATGGTESLLLELASKGAPIAIIAHKLSNSLAAALEAKARLDFEGYPNELFLLSDSLREDVRAFLKASTIAKSLRNLKIVLIGNPSPWLIYSSLSIKVFESDIGIKFVRVPIDEAINMLRGVSDSNVRDLLRRFTEVRRVEPSTDDLVKVLKLYVVLKNILRKYGADTLTIRCFDLIRYGLTACLPLSILNDEGYVAGCEGDVPATITMYVLSKLSEHPVFMGNIDWVEDQEVLIAHCTIPLKLTKSYTLRSHFESGISVGIEGYLRKGEEVTLARIDAVRKVIRVGTGTITNEEPPLRDKVCRTQILIKLNGNPYNLLKESIGNHYVLALGDYRRELGKLAKLLKMKYEEI